MLAEILDCCSHCIKNSEFWSLKHATYVLLCCDGVAQNKQHIFSIIILHIYCKELLAPFTDIYNFIKHIFKENSQIF